MVKRERSTKDQLSDISFRPATNLFSNFLSPMWGEEEL
jgi:hypothetical protein